MKILAEKLQKLFATQMMPWAFEDDEGLFLYTMTYMSLSFSLFIHVCLFTVFALFREWPFAGINAVSVTVYMLLFPLIKKRKCSLVVFLLSVEVILYSIVISLVVGISNYVIGYYLLVVIMHVMTPSGSVRARQILVFAVFLCVVGSILLDAYVAPLYSFPPFLEQILTVTNICIMFFGAIAELIVGNLIKDAIAHVNATKMAELESQANTDPLTGIYNRRYANIFFAGRRAKMGSKNLCVAMLDIDDFKVINDSLGHACGDTVLRFLADFLVAALRRTDIVFRWGGEEFLVVLEGADVDTAYTVLDNIRRNLAASVIATQEGTVQITVTVGIAHLDLDNPFDSIDESDKKLYEGKAGGKNIVVK